MSTTFGKKDGILIRIMTKEDLKRIGKTVYDDEPLQALLNKASKIDPNQPVVDKYEDYHNSLVEQGTCLVAIDEENDGHIVGYILAGCETLSDIESNYAKVIAMDDSVFKTICMFEFETKLKVNYFKHYGVSKVLYATMINVENASRGKGLGSRLAAALGVVSHSNGFKVVIAWSTSFYSARQMEAMGMECIFSLAYADYKDANGEVVFKPPAPHTQLRILGIYLTNS